MLIVIEGLDGSGKSTQVKKIRSFLQERVDSLKYIHFPRYEAPLYGGLISEFLRGDFGGNDAVHPKLVALLFAEDRHGAAAEISRALDCGATVLLDRYVYSNIAYQCAKLRDEDARASLRDWIFDTEYRQFGIPRPDLNIFLDVPISFVSSKLSSKRQGGDREYLHGAADIHEADISFQKKVRQMYMEQCSLDSGFIRVDCADKDGGMLPAEEIFQKLKEQLEKVL